VRSVAGWGTKWMRRLLLVGVVLVLAGLVVVGATFLFPMTYNETSFNTEGWHYYAQAPGTATVTWTALTTNTTAVEVAECQAAPMPAGASGYPCQEAHILKVAFGASGSISYAQQVGLTYIVFSLEPAKMTIYAPTWGEYLGFGGLAAGGALIVLVFVVVWRRKKKAGLKERVALE
jgi:hypothetical protein